MRPKPRPPSVSRSRGFFLTFEGLDGCGKTTQLRRLARALRRQGLPVLITREPGGTRLGERIRDWVLHRVRTPLDPHTELLLLFASRAQNVAEVIRPALVKGKIVLSDRFTDASLAYQGYGRGLDRRFIRELDRFACQGLQPDLSFVLDIDPRISVERARQRQPGRPSRARSQDRFEREALAFYRRVRRGYRELARREPRRVQWIHAQDTIERVQERILERAGSVIDAARRHGRARGRRP